MPRKLLLQQQEYHDWLLKLFHAYENNSLLKDIYSEKGKVSAKDVFDCVKEGDILANEIVNRVVFYLGIALANVGNVFNPEKIIIGGGVSRAGKTLLDPLIRYFQKFAFSTVAQSTRIDLATLGNDAGVIGAAWLIQGMLEINKLCAKKVCYKSWTNMKLFNGFGRHIYWVIRVARSSI